MCEYCKVKPYILVKTRDEKQYYLCFYCFQLHAFNKKYSKNFKELKNNLITIRYK